MKTQRIWLIIAILFISILFSCGYFVWTKYQLVNTLIEEITPKYSRMAGLIEGSQQLEFVEKSSQLELEKLAFPVWKTADEIADSVEQSLREIVKSSQMDLVSIQTFPPQAFHTFDQVVFDIKAEGDIISLHEFLNLVKVQIPFFWIEQISFQSSGASRPNTKQRVLCQAKIFVLRSN